MEIVDVQPVKRFDRAMRCTYIKFWMLQVRKKEISLRKCSGGSAQLRTLEGTLMATRESARFDNNDSEPKSQVRLRKFPEERKIFKDTYCQKHFAIFLMSERRWMFFAEAIADDKVEEY